MLLRMHLQIASNDILEDPLIIFSQSDSSDTHYEHMDVDYAESGRIGKLQSYLSIMRCIDWPRLHLIIVATYTVWNVFRVWFDVGSLNILNAELCISPRMDISPTFSGARQHALSPPPCRSSLLGFSHSSLFIEGYCWIWYSNYYGRYMQHSYIVHASCLYVHPMSVVLFLTA